MICIYRRLNDDSDFVNYPKRHSNTAPQTTDESPMNDAYSFRFSLMYANGSYIPDTAVIRQNSYYNEPFYEIEV